MENPKRCKTLDRLSELPDSLIFAIFWLLPMTDVVRTSVLSKRWRNLWTTTPYLNFNNHAMLFDDGMLWRFINRALLRWNGNRALKFRFDSRHRLPDSMFRDVNSWLNFATRNGVEELHSHVPYSIPADYCAPPQCLYSCSSLKELTLEYNCNLKIYDNVQWNQLKSIKINSCATVDVINQILCGCPQLREFILRYYDRGGNLSIQSSSLKKLLIYMCRRHYLSELRIFAPNVETLHINGISYSKCLLTNVSSLRRTTLGFVGHNLHGVELSCGNALSQILAAIRHVENVALLCCCTKVLGAMKMKCTNSSFPNVKDLELSCCFYDYKQVVGVLEMFPHLERLVLSDKKGDDDQDHDGDSLKFEANLPESFLLQLRTVEVTWAKGNGVFPLIEILLKYASKLEKIVFQLVEIKAPAPSPPPPLDLFGVVSQKLLRMPRSSTTCIIDLTKLLVLS